MNRLRNAKSPYLLQHADNPVDWYPWGDAAFERARRDGKPVFLSVGYSTCHWCHVMAHESFENAAIAAILNQDFIAIKLDREERPDIDRAYMTYVQAVTGSGGWPMSVWLTPDRAPFMGGTYFPPEARWGQPGFKTVLLRIADAWRTDRQAIEAGADHTLGQLRQFAEADNGSDDLPGDRLTDTAYRNLQADYDSEAGGFGGAPKFPRPVTLDFLLRYHLHDGPPDAATMVLHTLRRMAEGGIYDQLGGGFHRYSVDATWLVPHFEKMLYDQAQLAVTYLTAFHVSDDPLFADITRGILDYVLDDMTGTDGGFFSAEDADSPRPDVPHETGEGAYYLWTAADIHQALDDDTAAVFCRHYGIRPNGNVPAGSDPHGEFKLRNILAVRQSLETTAGLHGLSPAAVSAMLADARRRLAASRRTRPRPHCDDKILTAWNGLMIAALARAAQTLATPHYGKAAAKAANFIASRLFDPATGRLYRRYRDGEAAIDGLCDDYAFLIRGLLDLFEYDGDPDRVSWALTLQRTQDRLFRDDDGAYFNAPADDTGILPRDKSAQDGAEPSANTVTARNLIRLAAITGQPDWRNQAESLFKAFNRPMTQSPDSLPGLLSAFLDYRNPPRQIVVAGRRHAPDTRAMLQAVRQRYATRRVLVQTDPDDAIRLTAIAPWLEPYGMLNGKATAYVCENFTCRLPVTNPEALSCQNSIRIPDC